MNYTFKVKNVLESIGFDNIKCTSPPFMNYEHMFIFDSKQTKIYLIQPILL